MSVIQSSEALEITAYLLITFLVSAMLALLAGKPLSQLARTRNRRGNQPRNAAPHLSRLGGVGVFAALLGGLFGSAGVLWIMDAGLPILPDLAIPLALASSILFIIGLFDDLHGVTPVVKLVGQSVAALIMYYGGFRIEVLSFIPGHELALGIVALPVTILWLVGVSNAFNLIDGVDGLAAGVGIIALATVTAGALILENTGMALYSVALTGGLVGFLRYNFPPARILLGDSGSLVVGFLLAVLTVKGGSNTEGVVYALVPIFSLGYPLLDTGVAMMRRWLRGVPLSRGDSRHIHHLLAELGLTRGRSVLVICAGSAVLAALGLSAAFANPIITIAATITGVILVLSALGYGIGKLGYDEFLEAGASVMSAARNGRLVIQDKINARDVARSIQSASSLEAIAEILSNAAKMFRFAHMELRRESQAEGIPDDIIDDYASLRLWKLKYPISGGPSADAETWILTIWGKIRVTARPVGAERIGHVLAPAISSWLSARRQAGDLQEETRSVGN
ncbi:MAG TPA: hypothetical protein VHM24_01385 [Gemmatimonadaceae bacterium]|nr:hypothetical protein [Gemmatimonadaceae bacterium]